jgi:DNA-binding LytR/AlgR family response regulator
MAIVEDDPASAGVIKEYVDRYTAENGSEFIIDFFTDGDEITYEYNPVYDIIFMDVEMKRQNGMSAATYIRGKDKTVEIIFITHMGQYAIRGYAVEALSFLLKPVQYFAFSQELKRALQKINSRKSDGIILPTENGSDKVLVGDIRFIESSEHRLTVYANGKEYTLHRTMKEMEKRLAGKGFARCNNGYIVNLAYVSGIRDNCVVVEGHNLLISRPRKKAFMAALTAYYGGGG